MSVLKIEVEEAGSVRYKCDLLDELGVAIAAAAIATLTATLYDVASDDILNSRDGQNVKNANGGVVGLTDGSFYLDLLAADNRIVDATSTKETHKLLLELALIDGKTRNWERKVVVTNLHRVP